MDQRPNKIKPDTPPSEAAAYWMMRKHSGSMDAAERAAFEKWLYASRENAREFEILQTLMGRVEADAEAVLTAEFERELWEAASPPVDKASLSITKIAATLLIASLAVVIALFLRQPAAPAAIDYKTAIGEARHVVMEDGSEAELNTDSRLTVSYGADLRTVTLHSGEAFFNVEKDKSRPFLVQTEQARITVTGTSFGVSEFGGKSSVHVLTGVVDVSPNKGPAATLLAGDAIEISADGSPGAISRYDPGIVLAWRSGKARFREEPLANVLLSLNRYFETPIELGDPSLASLPVTGEFDVRDRDTTVRALALAFNLDNKEEPARIILNPKQHP